MDEELEFIGDITHDKTTTPSEKLDAILFLFYRSRDKPPIYPYHNNQTLTKYRYPKDIKLTESERDKIIDKLFRDKYIDMSMLLSNVGASAETSHYKINIDGEFFAEGGGYSKQLERTNLDDKDRKTMANNMWWATFWLAVGTVGLLVWEIVKYFLSCHCVND